MVFVVCGLTAWFGSGPCHAGQALATTERDDGPRAANRQASGTHIAELIDQLGARWYAARRRAARELVAIGAPAKDALLAARDHRDPEVRYRVYEVLESVLKLDFQRRLEAFLADADENADHELAGWPRFRDLAGGGGAARRLFAAMQQAERELLETAEQSPVLAGEVLEERCEALRESQQQAEGPPTQPPALASIAAVLFVAGDPRLPISQQAGTGVHSLAVQDELFKAATSGEKAAAIKRLLGRWVGRAEALDAATANQSCILALYYRLPDGVELARSLLRGADTPPHVRQVAIQTLAKLGGKAVVAELTALLDVQAECGAERSAGERDETVKTLICDVALASLVYLTGQKLGDYGFDSAQSNTILLFDAHSLGFADPAARATALAKWRQWAAEHAD